MPRVRRRREAMLFVRLSREERAALKEAARRDDRTMSSWTRLAILRALQAEKRKRPELPLTPPASQPEPEAVPA